MPKIANQTIYAKAEDGTEYKAIVPASISASGDFRVQCPPELQEICEKFSQKPGLHWQWYQSPGKYRKDDPYFIEAKQLSICQHILKTAAEEHLKCEVVRERVILYALDISCAFWRNDDGQILPSGHAASGGPPGGWYQIQSTKQDFHSANRIEDTYKIGLAARAWTRVSYIRPSGTVKKWERLHPPEGHLGYKTPLQKLQSFCSINVGPESENVRMMPYTDAAALWFHDAMLALFRMAYGFDQFFASADNLLAIQEGRASLLLTPSAQPQTRRQHQLQQPRE